MNNADTAVELSVPMPGFEGKRFSDLLTQGDAFTADAQGNLVVLLHPKSGRILLRD
ncbi:MAG: hypothetical protein AAGU04_08395 [Anaerolineaceae bacterium]